MVDEALTKIQAEALSEEEGLLVEVIWEDAGLESLQLTIEEALTLKPMLRKNIGYLIHQDEDKIILVFGFVEDSDRHKSVCDQILVLPIGIVRTIRPLFIKDTLTD